MYFHLPCFYYNLSLIRRTRLLTHQTSSNIIKHHWTASDSMVDKQSKRYESCWSLKTNWKQHLLFDKTIKISFCKLKMQWHGLFCYQGVPYFCHIKITALLKYSMHMIKWNWNQRLSYYKQYSQFKSSTTHQVSKYSFFHSNVAKLADCYWC